MMQDIGKQAAKCQEQFRASGLEGTMYVLSCPDEGWLRIQLRDVPENFMKQIIDGFQQTLIMAGGALNLKVKSKIRQGGQNG